MMIGGLFEWLNKGKPNGISNDSCKSSAHCSLPSGFDFSNPHLFILLRSRELIAQKTKQQLRNFHSELYYRNKLISNTYKLIWTTMSKNVMQF